MIIDLLFAFCLGVLAPCSAKALCLGITPGVVLRTEFAEDQVEMSLLQGMCAACCIISFLLPVFIF